MIANLIGQPYSAIVASSCIVIWKPPSPQTDQTSSPGFAPRTPLSADRDRGGLAPQLVEAAEPVRPLNVLEQLVQLPQAGAGVALEGGGGADGLADLRRGNLVVVDLRLGRGGLG